MKKYIFTLTIFILTLIISCQEKKDKNSKSEINTNSQSLNIPEIQFEIIKRLPHDTSAFTEGFLVHEKSFYESTGSPENIPFTKSIIGIINQSNGNLEKKIEIDKNKFFGEGIVILNDKIYQLTYQNKIGFIYDLKTFKKIGDFKFNSNEGWGFTTDGKNLIMSDGTNKLTYLNPNNLSEIKTLKVYRNGIEENNLNELEFINGYIYANVWLKNYIVKISAINGEVLGIINLEGIVTEAIQEHNNSEVLNGIAYDKKTDKIYITGKLWKNIYQINFKH